MRCPALHRIIEDCNIIVAWCSIFLWSSSLFVYATDSCAELQFHNTQVYNHTLTAEEGTQVQIPFSVIRKRCNNSDSDYLRIIVSRWSNTTSMYFPSCNIIQKQNVCRNSTSGSMTDNATIACICLGNDGEYLVTMTVTEKDFTKWQWSINGRSDTIIWITKSGATLQFDNTQVSNNTLTADTGTQVYIPFSVKYKTRNKLDELQIIVSRWNNATSLYLPLCNIIQKQNVCRNSTSGSMTSNETIACVCLGTDGKYLVTMTVTEKDFTKWKWSIQGESDTIIWITKSATLIPSIVVGAAIGVVVLIMLIKKLRALSSRMLSEESDAIAIDNTSMRENDATLRIVNETYFHMKSFHIHGDRPSSTEACTPSENSRMSGTFNNDGWPLGLEDTYFSFMPESNQGFFHHKDVFESKPYISI